MAVINVKYLKVIDKLYNITTSGRNSGNQHTAAEFIDTICYMPEGYGSIPD
jgi:hypothetical protein